MPKRDEEEQDDKRIVYDNGDIYEGDKDKRDRPHGRGIYIHHNQSNQIQQGRYDGEWEDGEKHGFGTHYYRNGDRYEGPWVKGKRHGTNGKYTYHNKSPEEHISDEYMGEWEDDMKHGKGIMTFTNGDVYEGHWVRGDMEDKEGTYTSADGSVYIGPWKKDKKEGKGKLSYANGDIYEGMFKNGKRDGKGKYTFHDGQVTEGTYSDDRRTDYKVINDKQATTTTSNQFDSSKNKKTNETEEVLA